MRARLAEQAANPHGRNGWAERASPVTNRSRGGFQPAFVSSRILVADDNVDAAMGLGEWLEAMGYEVHIAFDGSEALEMAQRLRPDAILLDIAMPSLNGDEVCRRLREEPWAEGVLMVAVTGFSGPEERRRSLDSGFDFHFVKPVDPRDIRALLQSL
jgi:CheY-like chemotaxis protein